MLQRSSILHLGHRPRNHRKRSKYRKDGVLRFKLRLYLPQCVRQRSTPKYLDLINPRFPDKGRYYYPEQSRY